MAFDRKQYYLDRVEDTKIYNAQYYLDHAETIKRNTKQNGAALRRKQKLAVFTNYGLKCELCSESRLGSLNIDHTLGGGNQHRRTISDFYRWLYGQHAKIGIWPRGYRVLCANHNWKEHWTSRPLLSQTRKLIRQRDRALQIKLGVFEVLGGATCFECGCTDLDVLTIHHLDNDGGEHRREISHNGHFYHNLMKFNDFSRPMVVSCRSCNSNAEFRDELS